MTFTKSSPAPTRDAGAVEELASLAAAHPAGPHLGELYEHYADKVFRFIYLRVGDHASAEDLHSEVWEKVARAIGTYTSHGDGSFPAWLFTIARRHVVSHWRKRRGREVVTANMLALDVPSSERGPDDAAEHRELAQTLADSLKKIGRQQRECVVLRFFHGLTIAETARVMGKSEGAVKIMQHRALKALAQVMPDPERNPTYAASVSTCAGFPATGSR